VSCGEVHSQAREIVARGYTATLVAATLAISRPSLYYRNKPEAAGLTEPTMNRSWWRVGKNPRMGIAA
jgi:hypothetical protein